MFQLLPPIDLGAFAFGKTGVKLCNFGGTCDKLNDRAHAAEFMHRPMCPMHYECNDQSEAHLVLWRHPSPCPYGGACSKYEVVEHLFDYIHPPRCQSWEKCVDTSEQHYKDFLHPPVCDQGFRCPTRETGCGKRHFRSDCAYSTFCTQLNDSDHHKLEAHPHLGPCEFFRNCPKESDKQHCGQYSHMCKHGQSCKQLKDADHLKRHFHVVRPMCTVSDCRDNTEFHLDHNSHEGRVDVRDMCKDDPTCTKLSDDSHVKKYRHPGQPDLLQCEYNGLNAHIDFFSNTQKVEALLKKAGVDKPSDPFLKLVRNFRPAHRCSPQVFESILTHGSLISNEHMQKLNVHSVLSSEIPVHPVYLEFCAKHGNDPAFKVLVLDLLKLVVEKCYLEDGLLYKEGAAKKTHRDNISSAIKQKEATLLHGFNVTQTNLAYIEAFGERFAKAALVLVKQPAGINYEVDLVCFPRLICFDFVQNWNFC